MQFQMSTNCLKMNDIILFEKYHEKYPSHGYRWLNAKIKLDTGANLSDQYAHRCCKFAGIKSKSKHYAYKNRNGKLNNQFAWTTYG